MNFLDRAGGFASTLVLLGLYVVILFVGVALITRPQETARLIFGPRGIALMTRILQPATTALGRRAWGRRLFSAVGEISRRSDAAVAKVLGNR